MADPNSYVRAFSFTGYQTATPQDPLPGPQVDTEIDGLTTAVNAAISAVKDIRRSDGALKNGIVTKDALAGDFSIGFTNRGLWVLGTAYAKGDGVTYGQKFYRAASGNTATNANRPDVDAATWTFLSDLLGATPPDGSISTPKLVDGAVTGPKLDSTLLSSLTTRTYADGTFIRKDGATAFTAKQAGITPADSDALGTLATVGYVKGRTTHLALGSKIRAARQAGAVSVAFYGDSIFEGLLSGGPNTLPNSGLTGTTTSNIPATFAQGISYLFSGVTATVRNRAFAGKTVKSHYAWITAQTAPTLVDTTDIAFFMFGYNDAFTNGDPVITPTEHRDYYALQLERVMAQGTVPVIVLPHTPQPLASATALHPYADVARQVARDYGVLCISMDEQIDWMAPSVRWSDGLHGTTTSYSEMGYHLAALFSRDGGENIRHVGPGMVFYPEDHLGSGGVYEASASARTGNLLKVTPGNAYAMGFVVEEECFLVVTTVNTGGVTRAFSLFYAGAAAGVPTIAMSNDGTTDLRRRFLGHAMHKGLRTAVLLNQGAQDAYIESIEFVAPARAGGFSAKGRQRKSQILSGWCSQVNAANDYAVDYGDKLVAPFKIRFNGTLPASGSTAITISDKIDQGNDFGSGNQILVMRGGTGGADLIIRFLSGGAASGTDVTTPGAFTASSDFTGEIEVTNTGTQIQVTKNGVGGSPRNTPPFTTGYAGLLSQGSPGIVSRSVMLID